MNVLVGRERTYWLLFWGTYQGWREGERDGWIDGWMGWLNTAMLGGDDVVAVVDYVCLLEEPQPTMLASWGDGKRASKYSSPVDPEQGQRLCISG